MRVRAVFQVIGRLESKITRFGVANLGIAGLLPATRALNRVILNLKSAHSELIRGSLTINLANSVTIHRYGIDFVLKPLFDVEWDFGEKRIARFLSRSAFR
jgi:hypothetical protein